MYIFLYFSSSLPYFLFLFFLLFTIHRDFFSKSSSFFLEQKLLYFTQQHFFFTFSIFGGLMILVARFMYKGKVKCSQPKNKMRVCASRYKRKKAPLNFVVFEETAKMVLCEPHIFLHGTRNNIKPID